MVYSEHDLAFNLTNALAVNDAQAVNDIFMSEVSNLLQNNKPALVAALKGAGAKISDDASDEKVAGAVAEAIVKNRQDVRRAIWNVIVREKQKYSNANEMITGILEVVAGAEKMAGEITVASLNAKTAKQQGKDALANARLGITSQLLAGRGATEQARTLAQIEREKGKASSGNVGMIIGGVIVVSIIGVIGFVLYTRTASATPTA